MYVIDPMSVYRTTIYCNSESTKNDTLAITVFVLELSLSQRFMCTQINTRDVKWGQAARGVLLKEVAAF